MRNEVKNVEFARAADNVLSNRYPDSGTTGRNLLALLLGGAAGGHFAPAETASTLAALGLASIPYTKGGNALAQMALTARPEAANALANAMRQGSPLLAPGIAGGINSLVSP